MNGNAVPAVSENGMLVLDRTWNRGDRVELHLPMHVELSRWVENSVSVARGPLVYVLKIGEEWTEVENSDKYGDFKEVRPLDPWNYGLLEAAVLDPEDATPPDVEQAWQATRISNNVQHRKIVNMNS